MHKHLLAALFACGLAGNAAAVTLYDEALQGDLSNPFDSGTDNALTLQDGANTIMGSSMFLNAPDVSNWVMDFDGFRFTLNSDQVIQSIVFTVTHVTTFGDVLYLGESPTLTAGFNLYQAPDTMNFPLGNVFLDALKTGPQLFAGSGLLPLSTPGTYNMINWGLGSNIAGGGNWDYQITLNVAPAVPEPANVLMMGFGLAMVLGVARRRKNI